MKTQHTSPALPASEYHHEVVAGGVKDIKNSTRRSDAMIFMAPSRLTFMKGFNVRVANAAYEAHVRALADDMKENGYRLAEPISVFIAKEDGENVIYVQAGHSRTLAALLAIEEGADFTEVPIVIQPKTLTMVDMTIDLVRSNSGRPLTMFETSMVVKRLEHMGLTEADIARRLSLGPSYVNGLMVLAGAPRAIAHMVVDDQVSGSTAIEMIRKHGTGAVAILQKALEIAAKDGKTKVTAAGLPGAALAKTLKKSAPRLYEAAKLIQRDPGYSKLSEESREALEELLATIREQEPSEEHLAEA